MRRHGCNGDDSGLLPGQDRPPHRLHLLPGQSPAGAIPVRKVFILIRPKQAFERYQNKWGIPFDPQTIYYKGNVDSQPPPDIGQIVRPVEGRILKKLKAMDMAEDEEMQQATERHDEMLLG